MKKNIIILFLLYGVGSYAQKQMISERLLKLYKVTGLGLSKDKKYVVYNLGMPNMEENTIKSKLFMIPLAGGTAIEVNLLDSVLYNDRISPDGKYIISARSIKVKNIYGSDFYPELNKSNVHIYESLNYRHWDTWEDGKFDHVFISPVINGKPDKSQARDIMLNDPYDCPQKPFGGNEDFIWNPDSKRILYVTKKKYGTDYTISTNTDLYEYNVETGKTKNLTEGMMGYDVQPAYNTKGQLAWLSMKRDGYEADKQDIIVIRTNGRMKNLTEHRDDLHVEGFKWSEDGKSIFFWAAVNGTLQLFEVSNFNYEDLVGWRPEIKQITNGDFDVENVVAQKGNTLVVARTEMNHAAELYTLDILTGQMNPLTHVNDYFYHNIDSCKTERRWVNTTDNKKMLVWIIYPPNFDASKKYPALLYCQGGPQSPLTQMYSFRWNFQLMASQGYIVVAPNRRGMPGHGTKWNEQVSKDWGGQVMQDYLNAIDDIRKEPFVDKNRLGCVGASFGGFSVFMLAAIHENRFKSFIAHDGVFDFRSMYCTTDEIFFETWEKGGAYWEKNNAVAQRSFSQSPSNYVDKWNTPILIIQGGKDYRVPIEQGLQAFQAAQLKGIKSKLLYFPEENHWVLSPQNALIWQKEFFKWLKETL